MVERKSEAELNWLVMSINAKKIMLYAHRSEVRYCMRQYYNQQWQHPTMG